MRKPLASSCLLFLLSLPFFRFLTPHVPLYFSLIPPKVPNSNIPPRRTPPQSSKSLFPNIFSPLSPRPSQPFFLDLPNPLQLSLVSSLTLPYRSFPMSAQEVAQAFVQVRLHEDQSGEGGRLSCDQSPHCLIPPKNRASPLQCPPCILNPNSNLFHSPFPNRSITTPSATPTSTPSLAFTSQVVA